MSGIRETRVFTYPNMIVRVHFPDITDEERKRRMKIIRDAAERVLREKMRVERLRAKKNETMEKN